MISARSGNKSRTLCLIYISPTNLEGCLLSPHSPTETYLLQWVELPLVICNVIGAASLSRKGQVPTSSKVFRLFDDLGHSSLRPKTAVEAGGNSNLLQLVWRMLHDTPLAHQGPRVLQQGHTQKLGPMTTFFLSQFPPQGWAWSKLSATLWVSCTPPPKLQQKRPFSPYVQIWKNSKHGQIAFRYCRGGGHMVLKNQVSAAFPLTVKTCRQPLGLAFTHVGWVRHKFDLLQGHLRR